MRQKFSSPTRSSTGLDLLANLSKGVVSEEFIVDRRGVFSRSKYLLKTTKCIMSHTNEPPKLQCIGTQTFLVEILISNRRWKAPPPPHRFIDIIHSSEFLWNHLFSRGLLTPRPFLANPFFKMEGGKPPPPPPSLYRYNSTFWCTVESSLFVGFSVRGFHE